MAPRRSHQTSARVIEHILNALGNGRQHGAVHNEIEARQNQGAQDNGNQHRDRHIKGALPLTVCQRLLRAACQFTGLSAWPSRWKS